MIGLFVVLGIGGRLIAFRQQFLFQIRLRLLQMAFANTAQPFHAWEDAFGLLRIEIEHHELAGHFTAQAVGKHQLQAMETGGAFLAIDKAIQSFHQSEIFREELVHQILFLRVAVEDHRHTIEIFGFPRTFIGDPFQLCDLLFRLSFDRSQFRFQLIASLLQTVALLRIVLRCSELIDLGELVLQEEKPRGRIQPVVRIQTIHLGIIQIAYLLGREQRCSIPIGILCAFLRSCCVRKIFPIAGIYAVAIICSRIPIDRVLNCLFILTIGSSLPSGRHLRHIHILRIRLPGAIAVSVARCDPFGLTAAIPRCRRGTSTRS